jgi:hypothetical protein
VTPYTNLAARLVRSRRRIVRPPLLVKTPDAAAVNRARGHDPDGALSHPSSD